MNTNQEFENYQKAKKQVKEIKKFYFHLLIYIVITSFFLFINLKYSPKHLWFYWPILGWGIGMILHAIKVFNRIPFLGKDWEEKKIKEIMDKEKTKWQ